jgi:hypothetical protein
MNNSSHPDSHEASSSRRRFVKLAASGAMLIPIVSLGGCSEDKTPVTPPTPAAPAQPPKPAAQETAPAPDPQPAATTQPAAATAPMVKLDETDPVASSLGYRNSAADVDRNQFEKYQPGQACANCVLFQPEATAEAGWGACSIYPGKLVNADGWCSVYAPKA